MNSTEKMEERLKRVDMHDFFLEKINESLKNERYIETSWLIYACMENRFFRTLQKYKNQCKYCTGKSKCKKSQNELAISTKIACIRRLAEYNVSCISESFSVELLEQTQEWIKERNILMHDLLSLETYQSMDEEFKQSATSGKAILDKLYAACTAFREKFYTENYIFVFPDAAMEGCSCKPKSKKK